MSVAHEQWDVASSVGWTALMVAAGRAVETGRADGLVRDPWAERFAAAAGVEPALPTRVDQRWPAPAPGPDQDGPDRGGWAQGGSDRDSSVRDDDVQRYWDLLAAYQGVRSRYFDTALTRAAEEGADQVVLLAAGLDTRAFRLDWPAGTTVFEVDQVGVLDFKDRVLDEQGARATCERRRVDADLREDWRSALRRAGFDPRRKSAWLAEGLLPFLPAAAEADLLHAVDQLAVPGQQRGDRALRARGGSHHRPAPGDAGAVRQGLRHRPGLAALAGAADRADPPAR